MKRLRYIGYLLLLLAVLPSFSSCNNEDDLVKILTSGTPWRMSRLTVDGSSNKFDPNFWETEAERDASLNLYNLSSSYYTVTFAGAEINGEITGNTITVRGMDSSASGTWSANASSNAMSLSLSVSGSETDVLATIFMNGMQNVYKYSGDTNNLNLYFKDGDTTYVIGFSPQ